MNSKKRQEQVIAFVTSNKRKEKEMQDIMKEVSELYRIERVGELLNLEEVQEMDNINEFVKKKTLNAFKKIKMPIIVEHTMLQIPYFGGLPSHITKEFLKKMSNEAICEKMINTEYRCATARTIIGYCDGKKIITFEGIAEGEISRCPRGNHGFGWDAIFIPRKDNPCKKTYGEMMEEEKNKISMRRKAINKLREYLKKNEIVFYERSDTNKDKLKEAIKKKQFNKEDANKKQSDEIKLILFIGAGVPNNLKMPTWRGLLQNIGKKLGYDEEVFFSLSDDYLALAEFAMKEDKEKLLEEFKNNFSIEGEELGERDIARDVYQSSIYKSIVALSPEKIYTTNYEETLEKAFEIHTDMETEMKECLVKGLQGERNCLSKKEVRIIKIHGDIREIIGKKGEKIDEAEFDKKIVLTETSYFEAFKEIEKANKKVNKKDEEDKDEEAQKEKNLYKELADDIKANKIFVFLGYSLSDMNIRYFLYKMGQNPSNEIEENHVDKKERNFFVFTTTPDPVQEKILQERGMKIIYGKHPNQGKALDNFLYELVMARGQNSEKKVEKADAKEEKSENTEEESEK
ncbi:non-canonical purine NTP pyrophosphatase [Crassaminicella profunda]|uniref:non-canonical purine NTP pyrophosphatase n=1 Tax=Crassaminicella profunda TaxID=1286698 RepID=UPI001CA72E2A|nr:non-canonical purine NTP pyrophosphatase [Crassaminicella profunda]QZY54497.1 SIR2 family protein [Crassaminicella profunda]